MTTTAQNPLIHAIPLPVELIGEIGANIRGEDFWTLSRALESFYEMHEAIRRTAYSLSGAPVQLSFLRGIYEAGYGVGDEAEHMPLSKLIECFEGLRYRRLTGTLRYRAKLVFSPVEAEGVLLKMQNGTLVISAPTAPDTPARALFMYKSKFSGAIDMEMHDPVYVRPSAHLVAFSGREDLIAVLEDDKSSYAVQLLCDFALPRLRFSLPGSWGVTEHDAKAGTLCISYRILATFLKDPGRLVMYNWKTGARLVVAEGLVRAIGFAFITAQTFALIEEDCINIYEIPSTPTALANLKRTRLGLPTPHPNARVTSVRIHASEGDPGKRAAFTLRERLCILSMTVINTITLRTCEILICAKARSIQIACSAAPASREVAWVNWGPDCCRVLQLEGELLISDGGIRGLRAVIQQRRVQVVEDVGADSELQAKSDSLSDSASDSGDDGSVVVAGMMPSPDALSPIASASAVDGGGEDAIAVADEPDANSDDAPEADTPQESFEVNYVFLDFGDVRSLSGIEGVLPYETGASRGVVRRASTLVLPEFFQPSITTRAPFSYTIGETEEYYGKLTCPNDVLLDDQAMMVVYSTFDVPNQQAVEIEVYD
ncbi:unnamed protein product [Peniophora sp. CBMAI 1063]|nr:unnamed protein product [Peniophora sp. CBMAI 1063]